MLNLAILWGAFELLATLFQSIMFVWFTKNFLTPKLGKARDRIAFIVVCLIEFLLITISNAITPFEGVAGLLACIPILVYAFLWFNFTYTY